MNVRAKQKPAAKTAPARRPGRRPRDGGPELSREAVILKAVALARCEPLSDITILRLAREMDVTPALIHYYIGSRDELLSAVLNHALQDRMARMPPLTGDWRTDLATTARLMHDSHQRWPGLASYIATHNRFRLFQKVQPGETDWGLVFFDHMGRIFQSAGFSREQAALAYHLLMLFLVSVGSAAAFHQSPAEHADFILGYVSRAGAEEMPGAAYLVKPFSALDVGTTLEAGLQLLLDGFASWLPPPAAAEPKPRRRSVR
jgi:AcrR family transcriptional regulator